MLPNSLERILVLMSEAFVALVPGTGAGVVQGGGCAPLAWVWISSESTPNNTNSILLPHANTGTAVHDTMV